MPLADWIRDLPNLRWWLLLVGLAIAVQLAWVAFAGNRQPRFDEIHYISHANALAAGKGYVDEAGNRTAYWPVGYPALLSVAYRFAGARPGVAYALQILLGLATAIVVSAIGALTLGRSVGRLAALLLVLYPTHIFYSTLFLTEPLFAFLAVTAMLFLLKGISHQGWLVPAGIALGLAALTRPVILLLPLWLPAWFLLMRWNLWRAARATLLTGLFTLLTVAPWLVRNHQFNDSWLVMSTTGGENFWVGNYPGAFGGYARPTEVTDLLRDSSGYNPSRGYRMGLAAIREFPSRSAFREVQKISYFFALETDGVLWNVKGMSPPPPAWVTLALLALANAVYLAVIAFTALALLNIPISDPLASLFLVFTGYLVFVSAVFFGDPRYHYALIPLAAILAASALTQDVPALWDAISRRDARARRTALTLGAVCGIFFLLLIGNVALKILEARAWKSDALNEARKINRVTHFVGFSLQ